MIWYYVQICEGFLKKPWSTLEKFQAQYWKSSSLKKIKDQNLIKSLPSDITLIDYIFKNML